MFEKFRPLGGRVLIKRTDHEEKRESALIIIPDSAKEKAHTGKVIAVGAGRLDKSGELIPLQVKVGDIVYVGKYTGTEAGSDYVIVNEDDILGIVELDNFFY